MLGVSQNVPVLLPVKAKVVFMAKSALIKNIGTQLSVLGVKTVVINVKEIALKVGLGGIAGVLMVTLANPAAYIVGVLWFF